MDILLKDKPEFKERIENNVHIKQDVYEIVQDTEITNQIIELFTQFINQNYK